MEFNNKDLLTVEEKLLSLRNKKSEIVNKKINLQNSLSHHQNLYSNTKHNSKEFKDVKETRLILKNQLNLVEIDIKSINLEIKAVNLTRMSIEEYLRNNKVNTSLDINTLQNKITSLRLKYKDFTQDRTRISSLRVMASEFIDELDNLLK